MRPAILNPLFAETDTLKGVGPKLAKPMERLGLHRHKDVAYHFPTGFIERKAIRSLGDGAQGEQIITILKATAYRDARTRRGPFRVIAEDSEGANVSLIYFGGNSGWGKKQFPLGEPRRVGGRLDIFGDDWQIVHPDLVQSVDEDFAHKMHEPVYPLADGLTQSRMAQLARQVLDELPFLDEWIDSGLKERNGWPDWCAALHGVHEARDKAARDRLAYDELFAHQLAIMLVRRSNRARKGQALIGDGSLRAKLRLPFGLTGAQSRVISEIEGDIAQSSPMLRLLQGDVGSGKTVVALMSMLVAVEAGAQAAFLAPTEILARQHYESLRRLAVATGVQIAVLTGRDKGRVRESILMGLADGSIQIVVGTHAIFQGTIEFRNLGLAVIDEQHKFGVSQRLMLAQKGRVAPHMLAMTATPIPRTLTLSQYGEMDVSKIDELPVGRQAIDTRVVSLERESEIVEALARHVEAGGQAYWICPLVNESETTDLKAAETRHAELEARLGEKVGLVHGQMRGEDRDGVMEKFAANALPVLVATTVIEVGVDVPNATLMIIEHAERFGLAQLHQLRGRVGRGDKKSVCVLLRSADGLSETARERLSIIRESQDGFAIAEEDLRLRGGGEMLGTRQSGSDGFSVADGEQVATWMEVAADDARLLIERDGGLNSKRGEAARLALYLFERDFGVSLLRSG